MRSILNYLATVPEVNTFTFIIRQHPKNYCAIEQNFTTNLYPSLTKNVCVSLNF